MVVPSIVVLIIIAANVAFSCCGFSDPAFFDRYKFHIAEIKKNQQIRLLTAAFLHVDVTHLFFNMFTLYFFSTPVINILGVGLFLLVYLGSLFIGNLFAYIYYRNVPYYSAVGASGAVSGVLFSAIILNPGMKLMAFLVPIAIPAYMFAIVYLVYTIYGMKKQNDNIGHTTHLGGAIGGIIVTFIAAPYLTMQSFQMIGIIGATVLVASYFVFKN